MTRPLTNRLNLPAPFVRAVSRDPYDAGDSNISVTRLVAPPRKVALEALHQHEAKPEDVADRIFAMTGQIGHVILERAATNDCICERRFALEVLGWKVSGQADLIIPAEQTLFDCKYTSLYAVKDGLKPEWLHQINLLGYLCARNGITIAKAQIIVILRDWFLSKARRDPSYPQEQVQVLDVPIWPFGVQEAFMQGRVLAHQQARFELPECTREETWNGKRCADWCGAYSWCSQANKTLGASPSGVRPDEAKPVM